MLPLITYLNTIHPLSDDLKQYLTTILKHHAFTKKDFLVKEGQVATKIFFIKKGLARCFYLKDDKEISNWFMKEGEVIISVESFFKQIPSKESIQALEDCSIYFITANELQFAYRTYPEFNFVGRILVEKYYMLCEQRLYSLRMQKASERYNYLREMHPEIIQRVLSQHIASYLGVTMETLSRVKGKK